MIYLVIAILSFITLSYRRKIALSIDVSHLHSVRIIIKLSSHSHNYGTPLVLWTIMCLLQSLGRNNCILFYTRQGLIRISQWDNFHIKDKSDIVTSDDTIVIATVNFADLVNLYNGFWLVIELKYLYAWLIQYWIHNLWQEKTKVSGNNLESNIKQLGTSL